MKSIRHWYGDSSSEHEHAPAAPFADEDYETRLARATQSVRVHQSKRTLPLVAIAAAIFTFSYRNDAAASDILVWAVLVVLCTVLRSVVARRIQPRIEDADLPTLRGFENWLRGTSMLNGLVVGSGFWWVGAGGSEEALFAVTLLCCIYSIGAMINASVHYRSFAIAAPLNLGQGVLFSTGIVVWEPVIALSLVVVLLLELAFGRANASQFAETIRIRSENMQLVEQLRAEKQAVEQALVTAHRANESKSHFLAAASHDLRQPLHALSLYLGSLALNLTSERDKELMNRIEDATSVLRSQFDALLDLSQFDANGVQVELSNFRLDLLLERVVAEFEQDARAKGLAMSLSVDPWSVRSDAMQVERLIRNLIDNALRYTSHGAISVVASRHGDRAVVSITDTGIGISEEDQARVFQDFVQLHNRGRQRASGVGLGLAIVRRINELLGLELRLDSLPGRGTTFEFELPLIAGAVRDPRTSARAGQHLGAIGQHATVWAVDDDDAVREALKCQLESWGCDVIVAANGEALDGVRQSHPQPPHLVLIDDMLGTHETGLDIARRLGGWIDPDRVVLITGNTQPERLAEIRQSGFMVLLKPTRSEQLWRLVAAKSSESRAHTA